MDPLLVGAVNIFGKLEPGCFSAGEPVQQAPVGRIVKFGEVGNRCLPVGVVGHGRRCADRGGDGVAHAVAGFHGVPGCRRHLLIRFNPCGGGHGCGVIVPEEVIPALIHPISIIIAGAVPHPIWVPLCPPHAPCGIGLFSRLGTLLGRQLPAVSVAFGSGGSLPERSTTFALMVVWLRVPRFVRTVMVISCGSDGVCHFTHAS